MTWEVNILIFILEITEKMKIVNFSWSLLRTEIAEQTAAVKYGKTASQEIHTLRSAYLEQKLLEN